MQLDITNKEAMAFVGRIKRFNCECGRWMILTPTVHHDYPLRCECGAVYWLDEEGIIRHCHPFKTEVIILQSQVEEAREWAGTFYRRYLGCRAVAAQMLKQANAEIERLQNKLCIIVYEKGERNEIPR